MPATAPAGAAFDAIPAPAPAAAPAGDEKSMYDEAFGALRDGRYAESARLFRAFLDVHPDGELAPNALYWLGESYYVTQNFEIALDTFNELLRRFPQSPKAQDALLKVGYCHYELKQWPEAERALNEVVRRYPDTTVARLAQGRLRALRLDAQRR
jgi:tol-pal system protein YbgF